MSPLHNCVSFLFAAASASVADDLADARELFQTGRYLECIQASEAAIDDRTWNETWWHLKIRSELMVGQYSQSMATLRGGLTRHPSSIQLRLLGQGVFRFNNQIPLAALMVESIEKLAADALHRYTDAADLVTLGRVLLRSGTDPRLVLEKYFDRARLESPEEVDAYLATAELALDKHDYALAASTLQRSLQWTADDPDVHVLLARSFAPSEPERASTALDAALERNPRHIPSLLLGADKLIDAESYDEARELLAKVLEVNPTQWQAHAYLFVLAHLGGDQAEADRLRAAALSAWSSNPGVDHLIGLKLSQKYRFREGSGHQREALKLAPDFLPARIQLAQDLLRLGEEGEGWRLAEQVSEADGYDVVAHNLVTLRESVDGLHTIERDGFVVRMDPTEAAVYGEEVLDLLVRARGELCTKYEVELEAPITVEIFPNQRDFAIRTFGLPGGAGFLGVCFGNVITANSPATRPQHPSSWQSLLWHEFCHVVTLNKTRNKMPRWLSEGISVYEERLEEDHGPGVSA